MTKRPSITQRGVFRLISDHHIQRGPYFPTQLDMNIDVGKGTVVTRSKDKDGKEQVSTEHMKLPPDLYNGLVTPIVKNLSAGCAGNKGLNDRRPLPSRALSHSRCGRWARRHFLVAGSDRKAAAIRNQD